ncbi:MAG: tetratricopeptide repeat protein [Gemmatimonadota bacterium]|nr:tetratricopeptide repeat protein [Gemmatimonadota bacterium]
MQIRFGLVLALALGLGLVGCASGGGGSQGGGLDAILSQSQSADAGENPRRTDNTNMAQDALNAAEEADEDGDTQQAQMHYRQALAAAELEIQADPTNPLGHRLAALAALGLEDYAAAGRHFDRAVELRPVYEFELVSVREQAWIDLYQEATPFVNSGDYAGAVEYFQDADAVYRGRPEAMVTLGQLHAQLRNHDEAIDALDRAIAFQDSENMAVADSATAATWQEQIDELPLLRAQVLADAGRFEEAAVAYRELSDQSPGDINLKRGLAAILMELNDEEAAFVLYGEMLDMQGLSAQDLFSIGVGFYQGSNYEMAAQAFRQAAEASRNDRDSIEMWARSLQLDSAYTQVPPVARRWIDLDPNSQNAYLILAQSANQMEDQATTQQAVQAVDALDVVMQNLQMTRLSSGGASVTGEVINKKLDAGDSVTLRFTFYDDGGTPIGSVTETVAVGDVDMSQIFSIQFDSAETVGGYGYQVSGG